MIIAIIVQLVLFLLISWIFTHYARFYGHYCQETEPFTRWFSRIAEAFPWFWWPLQVILIVYSAVTIRFAPVYWMPLSSLALLFMGWFVLHIRDYVINHHGDNPPIKIGFFRR